MLLRSIGAGPRSGHWDESVCCSLRIRGWSPRVACSMLMEPKRLFRYPLYFISFLLVQIARNYNHGVGSPVIDSASRSLVSLPTKDDIPEQAGRRPTKFHSQANSEAHESCCGCSMFDDESIQYYSSPLALYIFTGMIDI